jgi:virulence-associated protein VagC
MSQRARIINDADGQAVRLPKNCRFPEGQREVRVHRQGKKLVLEPVDEWPEEFLSILGSLEEEIERPPAGTIDQMKDPFE